MASKPPATISAAGRPLAHLGLDACAAAVHVDAGGARPHANRARKDWPGR